MKIIGQAIKIDLESNGLSLDLTRNSDIVIEVFPVSHSLIYVTDSTKWEKRFQLLFVVHFFQY